MFNLDDFKAARQQVQQRDSKRGENYHNLYLEAVGLLDSYQQSHQTETLNQALQKLMAALEAQRSKSEPYLLLAYVFYCFDEPQAAIRYLRAAEVLNAKLPQLELLRNLITQANEEKNRATTLQPVLDTMDMDCDLMFDKISQVISTQVRKLMMDTASLEPSSEPRIFLALQKRQEEVQTTYQGIVEQLDLIDTELDVSELRNQIKPFESVLTRLENSVRVSTQMVELQKSVMSRNQTVQRWQEQLPMLRNAQVLRNIENELEHILDDCDRLADHIDEFDDKGYQVSAITVEYEKLVSSIEHLQEQVDDAHDRLAAA